MESTLQLASVQHWDRCLDQLQDLDKVGVQAAILESKEKISFTVENTLQLDSVQTIFCMNNSFFVLNIIQN